MILNPISGKKLGLRRLPHILNEFRESGYQIKLLLTEKRGDATDFTRLWGSEHDLIVCIGGDGTFNEVVAGVMQGAVQRPIGYIPLGSTNDFAASMKLSRNWKKAVKSIVNGKEVPLDVCKFNERYFSYVASCGAFAKTSYSTPQKVKNALGRLAYFIQGIKDIPTFTPIQLAMDVEGVHLEGRYIMAALTNSTSVGGVLKLNPNVVDMSDGRLEIMLVPEPKNAVELGMAIDCLRRQQYRQPYVTFLSASELKITTAGDFDWSLDGEECDGQEHISIRVIPRAIRLLKA